MNLFRIPIRKVQKYAYCPRQYYLETILQIPPDRTIDLIKGELIHRRVDRRRYRSKRRKLFGISVELSHRQLGLIGIVDLIEISKDGSLIPVEFKKRSDEFFEPDWIGLTCYALCLEADGYSIHHLEIYSHENRRRYSRPLDKKLRETTLDTVNAIRAEQEFNRTTNRNKCHRCANRTFCWAEEFNPIVRTGGL